MNNKLNKYVYSFPSENGSLSPIAIPFSHKQLRSMPTHQLRIVLNSSSKFLYIKYLRSVWLIFTVMPLTGNGLAKTVQWKLGPNWLYKLFNLYMCCNPVMGQYSRLTINTKPTGKLVKYWSLILSFTQTRLLLICGWI